MKLLLSLFASFFKIGCITFGGGLAMLPMFQAELSEKRGWVTQEELADYYSLSQCTPGAIAVNTATFVGCKQKGAVGGIAATLGLICPSVIIIGIIAALLTGFADIPAVKNALAGIRACVVALVLNSVIKLFKTSVKGAFSLVIFFLCLAASLFTSLPVAVIILAAGAVGVIFGSLRERSTK